LKVFFLNFITYLR